MSKRIIPTGIMAVALLALAFQAPRPVSAALPAITFKVNSTLDLPDDLTMPGTCHTTTANACTLRAAVMQANRTSGLGATIELPSGTYKLTIPATPVDGEADGDLNLTKPVNGIPVISIKGAGAGTTIIDANTLDSAFYVDPGRTASISGVTIRNGYKTGAVLGGGIYNEGTLEVSDSLITQNILANGGSYAWGGGIFNFGNLTLTNSTVSHNTADAGGGIYNSGTLTITDSLLDQNTASGGGGIRNVDTLTVNRSTLSGNIAFYGGGIYNEKNLTMINSTISQNKANAVGGGIYNYNGQANIYNTSILFNVGIGVYNISVFNLRNTLVAGNSFGKPAVYSDCYGTPLDSYGGNLFLDVTGCTVIDSITVNSWGLLNDVNTLSPFLQNNGGPTWTHALLPGSNAIDAGDLALGCIGPDSLPLPTDQRGMPRVVNGRCDVGAYEYSLLHYIYMPLVIR